MNIPLFWLWKYYTLFYCTFLVLFIFSYRCSVGYEELLLTFATIVTTRVCDKSIYCSMKCCFCNKFCIVLVTVCCGKHTCCHCTCASFTGICSYHPTLFMCFGIINIVNFLVFMIMAFHSQITKNDYGFLIN